MVYLYQVVSNKLNVFCRQSTVMFSIVNNTTELILNHLKREKHRCFAIKMLASVGMVLELLFYFTLF